MDCADETVAPGVECEAEIVDGACETSYVDGIGCVTNCSSVVFGGLCSNGTEYDPLCGMNCGAQPAESSCCFEAETCDD